jgi:effector-binding domain-containing protein
MKKKHFWWTLAGIGAAAAVGAVMWGPLASRVERARYKTVSRERNIEIRDYTPMIVAEVDVSGDRENAIRQGFRTLADYIFGNNTAMRPIAMTAPVTQQGDEESWQMRFMMPARYTTDTLPKPIDPAVTLKHLEARRFAAIRFSGAAQDDSLRRHTKQLEEYIREQGVRPLSPPAFAFYNPPWTLPFLRRNEVLVEIARERDGK